MSIEEEISKKFASYTPVNEMAEYVRSKLREVLDRIETHRIDDVESRRIQRKILMGYGNEEALIRVGKVAQNMMKEIITIRKELDTKEQE